MRIRARATRIAVIGACCAVLGGALAGTASVMTVSALGPTSCVVNSNLDTGKTAGNTCDSTSGATVVTLRSAIEQFTANPATFTITFDASTNGTPILLGEDLLPQAPSGTSLTITGNGIGTTIIDGQHTDRIMTIGLSGAVPDVTINNVTLQNGQDALTAGIRAIDTSVGTLNLNGVRMTGMVVNGGHVNATSINYHLLNITNSTITGDQSTASTTGGDGVNDGEINAGTTTITGSSITSNTVTSAAGHYNKGLLDTSAITVTGSHIDSNTLTSTTNGQVDGIFDSSATTITNSTVNNNTISSGIGAYLSDMLDSSAMDFEHSSANGNTLTTLGNGTVDGVFDTGAATIKDSSVDNNTMSTGASGSSYGVVDTHNIDIERSSISGNSGTVGDLGEGNAIIWPRNINNILDSTISGNTYTLGRSATLSGFIYEAENTGTNTNFTNDTIAKNTLTQLNTVPTGGSFDIGTGGTTIFSNDIISGNTPSNCNGTALPSGSASHSLDSGTDCGMGSASGNLSSTDPKLGPLQVNAPGTTQTMAIDKTSPAYNTADNTTCPTVDQRGVTRLFAGDLLCDMGAYEAPLPLFVAPGLPAAGHSGGGQPGIPSMALWLLLAVAAALGVGLPLGARRGKRRA